LLGMFGATLCDRCPVEPSAGIGFRISRARLGGRVVKRTETSGAADKKKVTVGEGVGGEEDLRNE
jgi:hypothetical protein